MYVLAALPDLSWCNIPKRGKICQMTRKCTELPQVIPNGCKMDQMAIKYTNIFYILPKFIQTGIFGLKIYHLATPLFGQIEVDTGT
jgi:hypothetical protein